MRRARARIAEALSARWTQLGESRQNAGVSGLGDWLFGSRGRVELAVEPRIAAPGTKLRGTARFVAYTQPRLVEILSVGFSMVGQKLRPHSVQVGEMRKTEMREVEEAREIVPEITLCTVLPVPAGCDWSTPFELSIPSVTLAPTVPGHLDYYVVAYATVDGLRRLSARESIVIVASIAAEAGLAPGSYGRARAPEGTMERVLIVEVRGAVTLVQWPDGRPATWVPTKEVLADE
jgi:hypothetical protein